MEECVETFHLPTKVLGAIKWAKQESGKPLRQEYFEGVSNARAHGIYISDQGC